MVTRRSRNSYIRALRSVTLQPMSWPSRILKPAIAFLALVLTGFCPEIAVMSATAASSFFWSPAASPTPMLMTIFSSFGISIGFLYPNSFASSALTASL